MPQTTIEEVFTGPWGIVENRRREIEEGSYGTFDRIHREEIDTHFLSAKRAAESLACHPDSARRWLRRVDARFIVDGLSHLYFREDVLQLKAAIHEKLIEKSKAKVTRKDKP